MSLLKILVYEIEREIYFWTGAKLPTLRNQWETDAEKIQRELNVEHKTSY